MEDDVFEDDPGALSDQELQLASRVGSGTAGDPSEDADEDLNLSGVGNKVWLAKVPKYLADRWSDSNRPQNTDLGRLRVWREIRPDGTEHVTKMAIVLDQGLAGTSTSSSSSTPNASSSGTSRPPHASTVRRIPGEYSAHFTNEKSANTYVFATHEQVDVEDTQREGKRRRLQTPHIIGNVIHEVAATPQGDPSVSGSILKQKLQEAAAPKRTVKALDQGNDSLRNRLASGSHGLTQNKKFDKDFIRGAPSKTRPTVKATRVPKNELLDSLFKLFEEKEFWRIQEIRERTNQPYDYLRDVLMEIAVLMRGGDMNGAWKLNDKFADENLRRAETEGAKDDEMEEDEMEEVSNS